jgi:DNA helicase II / ATP-dependent DNA helicase PcrA
VLDTRQLLTDLTPEQREAVTHIEGPLLIIAGAGSGKTRVITRRVAYLISQGIVPSSILAITFTNKAAGEMKTRIAQTLERPLHDFGRLEQPWPMICTFHSLGLRILKHYAQRIGLAANFSIYDSSDQERLIKEAIRAADLSSTNFPPAAVHAAISNAKNRLMSPEAFADVAREFPQRHYARVYQHYQKLLAQNNALDFDDLLMKSAHAFRDHPDVLRELQERFAYILIDEYQDTNHAQYVLAHAMAMSHGQIAVVGDPDQSIYAWRGADIQNILDFEKDYPAARVVKLERNYRSTQIILDIASAVISRNRQRKDKTLWTENTGGQKARLLLCRTEHDEAQEIAAQFRQLNAQGRPWSDMAVFYRINSLSRVIEDALRIDGIPYRVARGVDFYHRKEIKDVLAYLRVIANPGDELSLMRIINAPARGIGDASLRQVQAHAVASATPLWQALQAVGQVPGIPPRASNAIAGFVHMVSKWQRIAAGAAGAIRELMIDVVAASGLEAYYRKAGGQELEELANIGELITMAAQFDEENPGSTLDEFLARISLVSDIDALKDGGGAVTLMTLHAAKGLEFPVVAMIAMEEGCLPHARVREHPEQLEEERRLCYVGITRARELLILSRAAIRRFRGVPQYTVASRFLAEMPAEAIEAAGSAGEADLEERALQEQEHTDDQHLATAFRSGQLVRHPSFGIGRIVDIASMGPQTRATVQFDRAGRKNLILQYARLEAVG